MAGDERERDQIQRLQVSLFGSLRVSGTRTLGPRDLGGVKPKQVLEILLLKRGRSVPKDVLADLIWGETLPRNVDATLATYVSVLRSKLSEVNPTGQVAIITLPGAYAIDTTQIDVDVDHFDALVSKLSDAHPSVARRISEQALSLVRGQLLEDEPYADWIAAARDRYTQEHIALLVGAARLALADDDFDAAWSYALESTTLEPLHEVANQQKMMAALGRGDRDAALKAYRAFEDMLVKELGVSPSRVTVELFRVIESAVDPVPVLSEGLGPKSQKAQGLPLLGRDRQVGQLIAAAETASRQRSEVVLLSGEHGVGKTRLLQELPALLPEYTVVASSANEVESALPGATLASILRSLESVLPQLSTLSKRLGLSFFDTAEVVDELRQVISSVRPLVLAIDDIHWADPESLRAISALVDQTSSGLLVVASWSTSIAWQPSHLELLRPAVLVTLEPLTKADVRALGDETLHARTGGLPLFVVDALEYDGRRMSDVSSSLSQAVIARWRTEGPSTYALLVAGSIFDEAFAAQDLCALSGASYETVVEQLQRLRERGALEQNEIGEYSFRYPIVKSILRRSVSPAGWQMYRSRLPALPAALQRSISLTVSS